MATTTPRDAKAQKLVRQLSQRREAEGLFTVDLVAWTDIVDRIYEDPELCEELFGAGRSDSQARLEGGGAIAQGEVAVAVGSGGVAIGKVGGVGPHHFRRKTMFDRLLSYLSSPEPKYDVVLSHAREDRKLIVRPLAKQLRERGFKVWFDETELRIGDRLRRTICKGLPKSRYGVVILSPDFFKKEWPQRELDALFAREVDGRTVVLSVMHNLSPQELITYAPMLADRYAIGTDKGLWRIVELIERAISGGESRVGDSGIDRVLRATEDLVFLDKRILLSQLGQDMLAADSIDDLRQVLFRIDSYLLKHPADPDAAFLKYKLESAVKTELSRTERKERRDEDQAFSLLPLPFLLICLALWLLYLLIRWVSSLF